MFSSSAFFFSTWDIMVFFSVRTLKIFILVPNMIDSTLLAPLNLTLYLSILYLLWVLLIGFHCYIVRRLISPVCWMLLAKVRWWTLAPACQRCSRMLLMMATWTWWLGLSPCELSICLWLTGDLRRWLGKICMGTVDLAAFHSQGRKASYVQTISTPWASSSLCVLSTEGGSVRIQCLFLCKATELPLSTSVLFSHILVQTDKSCYYRRWSW